MEKTLEIFVKYGTLIVPLVVFLAGWLLPAPKFFSLGKKAGEKIPTKIAKLIVERLDAFEAGLLKKEFHNDYSVVSNTQIVEEVRKVKVDLGLEE